mgnify:CR=1 FL=1
MLNIFGHWDGPTDGVWMNWILGGDGYLGWPTAMKLSSEGHDVLVVDNYSRRQISCERNLPTLISVPNLQQRVVTWKAKTGREILVRIGDVQEYEFIPSRMMYCCHSLSRTSP